MKSYIHIFPVVDQKSQTAAFELSVKLGRSSNAFRVTVRFKDLTTLLDVLYRTGFREATLAPLRSSMRSRTAFFCPPCELTSDDLQKLGIPFRVETE